MGIYIGFLGVMGGCLVAFTVWWTSSRRDLPTQPDNGKYLSLTEMTELSRIISEQYVRGIRSIMGLDLGGEIIEQPEEEADTPITVVRELEMDPFMMTEEEWVANQLGREPETNE